MELRNYQQECSDKINEAIKRGIRRQLVALPTGTGKTVIFANLIKTLGFERMIVLAHREELLDQAKDKIERSNPGINVGIEQGDRHSSMLIDNVVVASVATLGRKDSPRLKAFNPKLWPVIICDEAHHSVAPIYKNIFEHFGVFDSGSLLIGFTATPRRGDKVGLDSVYQEIVYQKDIRQMVDQGWLCQIRGYRIKTGTDLSGVRIVHGDFVDAELSEAVNTEERNIMAADAYKTYCSGRRALIFCVDRNHSREMANAFNASGIPCGVVLGDTPPDERAQTLKDLSDGKIMAIANCMVLTEGFDLPTLSAIIMARPTKSGLLYTQCVGRCTRISPGKEDAIVVDLTDNSRNHVIAGLPTLFGLPPNFDLKGKRTTELLTILEAKQSKYPQVDFSKTVSIEDMDKLIESFEMLKSTQIDDVVASHSKYIWTPGSGSYTMYLKDSTGQITIRENILGKQELILEKTGIQTILTSVDDIDIAFKMGDKYIDDNHSIEAVLYAQNARWRKDIASSKQIGMLKYLGATYPTNITKGEASLLIDKLMRERKTVTK